MPSIPKGSLVLLTGSSGFLAAHVGQQLLQYGYRVRGTVRSDEKGKYLKDLYAALGFKDFEWVIVKDVEPEGAFDEAVKGVDGIAHTASPFHFNVTDPYKDLINPAVNGTLSILKSAAKEPSIKRIVITSSFAAVVQPHDPVYTYTEKDWNEFSPQQVDLKGKDVEPFVAYRASKTLAEKSAWKFVEENKPGFDLTTINPPFIFGPLIHQITSASALNTSVAAFYAFLTGDKKDEAALTPGGSWVDVRDVAQVHVDALATPEAGGERFLVSNSNYTIQNLLDVLSAPSHAELIKEFPKISKGVPGATKPVQNKIDASKAKKTFGWTPIGLEKMVVDMTESLAERQRGW